MGETMSITLQYVYQNKLWELDRRNLEYFIINGAAQFKSAEDGGQGKDGRME